MNRKVQNDLDRTDRRILDALQKDGSLSPAEIAGRIGIATTTCWRRINQLQAAGVIKARVALLDRNAVGVPLLIFCHVKLSSQGRDAIARFDQAIRRHPEVLECYTLMGEWDFLLRVVATDIDAYGAFFLDHLSKIAGVQSINSSIVVTTVKETTSLPLG